MVNRVNSVLEPKEPATVLLLGLLLGYFLRPTIEGAINPGTTQGVSTIGSGSLGVSQPSLPLVVGGLILMYFFFFSDDKENDTPASPES